VDTVTVGAAALGASIEPVRDADDSWAELPPLGEAAGARFDLPSGRSIVWEDGREPHVDAEITLGFRVTEADGTPSALGPYMGMLSHAAVTRDDGSVFIHLHPYGSISMAAQNRFERAEAPEASASAMNMTGVTTGNAVTFPFVFSRAGAYRIFVQVKIGGTVETAAFDVDVPEA
jgi:hypothetical protein